MDSGVPHATGPATDALPGEVPDPRRWLTLSILILTVVLIALDTSVLNVSIPTMLRDLHTTVPALQWVITGYSLTFASLLIVGGRLGDIFGHRRMFIIGTTLFGVGSFVASISHSVGVLILGEAVIEGMGAALMTPASLALLSNTFQGRERAKAFAAWGAAAGAAVAFGPVIGGFLTTNYSWRWSFRINVIVAPIAAIGALVLMPKGKRSANRTSIDLPGAGLIAAGMFLIVFALSDGGTYGWFEPLKEFGVGGIEVWPRSAPISIVPGALALGIGLLYVFVRYEQAKARRHGDPLFDFGMLRLRSLRYGLLTLLILTMGQLGLLLSLPLFLQDAVHLSAQTNGLWLLPMGIFVIVGAQLSARLTRRFSLGSIISCGLFIEGASLGLVIWAVAPGITFWEIFPGLALFGTGLGLASAQLTSVILSEVATARSGVASGAAATARQMGGAFGAAIIGSLITVQTTNRAVAALRSATLTPAVRDQATTAVRTLGPSARPAPGLPAADAATIQRILTQSLATGARIALLFAMAVVLVGAALSLLIPRVAPVPHTATEELLETFAPFEPENVDPAQL